MGWIQCEVPQIQGCANKLENSNKKSEFRVQQIKIPLKKDTQRTSKKANVASQGTAQKI